jgi:predicted hotdog family 3-hydroxylacyl-ACP dehydratase
MEPYSDPYTVEDIIPHRGRMKLIDEILGYDGTTAETRATVTENWPLVENGIAGPVIMIELIAQTGGISVGIEALRKTTEKKGGKGWIVGVKSARFHVGGIPVGTRLLCRATKTFEQEFYSLLSGEIYDADRLLGEILIQVMRAETSIPEGPLSP